MSHGEPFLPSALDVNQIAVGHVSRRDILKETLA